MINIGAIVLAAGNSSRLGQPKQLLPHENGTLVEHAVRIASDAGCSPIVVVTGAVEEPIRQRVSGSAIVAHNADWSTGMGSSIRVGVASLLQTASACERVLILLSDQPALDVATLARLLQAWEHSDRPMAACRYGDSIGPPCGFARPRFDALSKIAPQQGAKALLRPPEEVATIDWTEGAFDVDTPGDWERWKAKR